MFFCIFQITKNTILIVIWIYCFVKYVELQNGCTVQCTAKTQKLYIGFVPKTISSKCFPFPKKVALKSPIAWIVSNLKVCTSLTSQLPVCYNGSSTLNCQHENCLNNKNIECGKILSLGNDDNKLSIGWVLDNFDNGLGIMFLNGSHNCYAAIVGFCHSCKDNRNMEFEKLISRCTNIYLLDKRNITTFRFQNDNPSKTLVRILMFVVVSESLFGVVDYRVEQMYCRHMRWIHMQYVPNGLSPIRTFKFLTDDIECMIPIFNLRLINQFNQQIEMDENISDVSYRVDNLTLFTLYTIELKAYRDLPLHKKDLLNTKRTFFTGQKLTKKDMLPPKIFVEGYQFYAYWIMPPEFVLIVQRFVIKITLSDGECILLYNNQCADCLDLVNFTFIDQYYKMDINELYACPIVPQENHYFSQHHRFFNYTKTLNTHYLLHANLYAITLAGISLICNVTINMNKNIRKGMDARIAVLIVFLVFGIYALMGFSVYYILTKKTRLFEYHDTGERKEREFFVSPPPELKLTNALKERLLNPKYSKLDDTEIQKQFMSYPMNSVTAAVARARARSTILPNKADGKGRQIVHDVGYPINPYRDPESHRTQMKFIHNRLPTTPLKQRTYINEQSKSKRMQAPSVQMEYNDEMIEKMLCLNIGNMSKKAADLKETKKQYDKTIRPNRFDPVPGNRRSLQSQDTISKRRNSSLVSQQRRYDNNRVPSSERNSSISSGDSSDYPSQPPNVAHSPSKKRTIPQNMIKKLFSGNKILSKK